MVVKSECAVDQYTEYFEQVRAAIQTAVDRGDSVASIASRIGVDRAMVNSIRNGTYRSILNSQILIAFDSEFDLGIFRK